MNHQLQLWRSYKEGDRKAFEQLYHLYYAPLMNYGYRFTQQSQIIEEAVQDLFVKLWQKRSVLSDPVSVKHYLYTSFRRVLLRILASSQNKSFAALNPNDNNQYSFNFELATEDALLEKENRTLLHDKLEKIIATLTPRQREAIYLRFFEELSFEEVAEIMDMQIGGTYKLIYRALEKMKEGLG